MPLTLPTVQPSIPDLLLNESLEPFSPPNQEHAQWTLARKVAVYFLAFVGVCILLQMSRSRNSTVDKGAEKPHAEKHKKVKATRASSSCIEASVNNGTTKYLSASKDTPVIQDSGVPKQEELRLASFSAIEIRIPANVTIVKGTQKVTLAADENIFNVLVAKVEGARLILEAKPHTSFETRHPIDYIIVVPSLVDLKVITAAKVAISKLEEASFKCWLESNALVEVQGQVTNQEVNVWDTATYQGRYLTSDKTTLQVYGAGKVHVKAVHQLIGIIKDNGECTYYGEPSKPLMVRTSSNGKINCHIDVYQAV